MWKALIRKVICAFREVDVHLLYFLLIHGISLHVHLRFVCLVVATIRFKRLRNRPSIFLCFEGIFFHVIVCWLGEENNGARGLLSSMFVHAVVILLKTDLEFLNGSENILF